MTPQQKPKTLIPDMAETQLFNLTALGLRISEYRKVNLFSQRHPTFYMPDSSIVFLVGTKLFRVYHELLSVHSEAFRGRMVSFSHSMLTRHL